MNSWLLILSVQLLFANKYQCMQNVAFEPFQTILQFSNQKTKNHISETCHQFYDMLSLHWDDIESLSHCHIISMCNCQNYNNLNSHQQTLLIQFMKQQSQSMQPRFYLASKILVKCTEIGLKSNNYQLINQIFDGNMYNFDIVTVLAVSSIAYKVPYLANRLLRSQNLSIESSLAFAHLFILESDFNDNELLEYLLQIKSDETIDLSASYNSMHLRLTRINYFHAMFKHCFEMNKTKAAEIIIKYWPLITLKEAMQKNESSVIYLLKDENRKLKYIAGLIFYYLDKCNFEKVNQFIMEAQKMNSLGNQSQFTKIRLSQRAQLLLSQHYKDVSCLQCLTRFIVRNPLQTPKIHLFTTFNISDNEPLTVFIQRNFPQTINFMVAKTKLQTKNKIGCCCVCM